MTSITQRAARALANKILEIEGEQILTDEQWAEVWADPTGRRRAAACVHAMVTAIREPTKEMAASLADKEDPMFLSREARSPLRAWQLMIDTILAEKDGER